MVDDSDQPTASAARKAVLRSPSPDSPLPKDPAAAASATPCGGSVELQRLRSHVLSIEALGSSGSSSDEDQEASESVQSAARTQQAAAPPDPQAGTCGPDACSSVQTSVAEMVSAAHEAPDVARSNSAGEASRTLDAVREVLNHGLDAKPPLIRHGGGALAGLLDSPEADFHAEAAEATAERFRRATGSLHRPAAAGDAADDARCGSAQRVPFASGKKRVGGWGPGAGLMNSSGQSQRPWPACTGPQQSSVGPQRLQQEHEQQLSDRAGRSGGGTTDDVELVQRQVRVPNFMLDPMTVQWGTLHTDCDAASLRPWHQRIESMQIWHSTRAHELANHAGPKSSRRHARGHRRPTAGSRAAGFAWRASHPQRSALSWSNNVAAFDAVLASGSRSKNDDALSPRSAHVGR